MDKKYSVKAISNLTGFTPDTLRAWERRYRAILPRREGKRRVYGQRELERLLLLKKASDLGHPIRFLAPMTDDELRDLVGAEEPEPLPITQQLVEALIDSIESLNSYQFELLVSRLAAVLDPLQLISEVISPLFEAVGDRWETGELTVAQEHMVSASLRNLLGALIRVYPTMPGLPSMLFATPSGERHEFGCLCAALLASSRGFGVHYLGPDLPVEETAQIAKRLEVTLVGISVVQTAEPNDAAGQIRKLRDLVNRSVSIWIGGAAVREIQSELSGLKDVHVAHDIQEFERRLHEITV